MHESKTCFTVIQISRKYHFPRPGSKCWCIAFQSFIEFWRSSHFYFRQAVLRCIRNKHVVAIHMKVIHTYHILHPPQTFNHACQRTSTTVTIAINQETCIGVLLVTMISHTVMLPRMRIEKMQLWISDNLRSNQFFRCTLSIVCFRRSHMGQCFCAIQADPPECRKRKLW